MGARQKASQPLCPKADRPIACRCCCPCCCCSSCACPAERKDIAHAGDPKMGDEDRQGASSLNVAAFYHCRKQPRYFSPSTRNPPPLPWHSSSESPRLVVPTLLLPVYGTAQASALSVSRVSWHTLRYRELYSLRIQDRY